MQDEELGVGPGPQGAHHLEGRGVDDLDAVVVARADEEEVAVLLRMPRGRRPTLTVLVTCRDFESITVMVSSFSFET